MSASASRFARKPSFVPAVEIPETVLTHAVGWAFCGGKRPVLVVSAEDPWKHGYLVWVSREDTRDCEEWFRPTLAEAKADLAKIQLWPGDSAGISEGEFAPELVEWYGDAVPSRGELTEFARRDCPPLTQAQAQMEEAWKSIYDERIQAARLAWRVHQDWLMGRINAPGWPVPEA